MKSKKIIFKSVISIPVIALLGLLLFKPVDRTPYQKAVFYHRTIEKLDSVSRVFAAQGKDTVQVGWSEAGITPPQPIRLTGKKWKPYEQVIDSARVRVILLANNYQKIAIISYDLWIIHPFLATEIREAISNSELKIDGIYFTASHTHSSIGGWAPGLLGYAVAGGYDKDVVKLIKQRTLAALKNADKDLGLLQIGYRQFEAREFVKNRLKGDAHRDTFLRVLKMKKGAMDQAFFSTYPAHATCVDLDSNILSTDYPGLLIKHLENIDSVNFSSYAAGTVGSHGPTNARPFTFEKMDRYAKGLAEIIANGEDTIPLEVVTSLNYVQWPVELREPHFRVLKDWRFRPWLFNAVVGETPSYISCLKINNTVLIGLPIEMSGEFYPRFKAVCEKYGFSLIITTFNGNYLGYVTPYEYYDTIEKAETRDMNWYGPQNGEYFVALINRLLAEIGELSH